MNVMYQGIRELKAAPGRTALITVTVGLIAVMVTFLSALAAGLERQSVSALDVLLGRDDEVVVADTGTPALASSRLDDAQVSRLVAAGGEKWWLGRAQVGDTPVTVLSDASLPDDHIRPSAEVAGEFPESGTAGFGGRTVTVGGGGAAAGAGGSGAGAAGGDLGDLGEAWWEHQAVVAAAPNVAEKLSGGVVSAVVFRDGADVPEVDGTVVMRGDDRYGLSASYTGEQMSLGAMTTLLYIISALVVGAFFMVWTVQRMRGVAVSSALGASRGVLAADSLGQALVVLALGVGAGVGVTAAVGTWLAGSGVMPVVIDAGTTVYPGLLLVATGLVGAAVALMPILRVEPRAALATA